MTIDHAVLVAEAQRRLDHARALDGEEWDAQLPTLHMSGVGNGVIRRRGGPWRVSGDFAAGVAGHIEVWDPAAAVAVCEGWLDVLRRHRPMDSAPRFCTECRDHVLLADCYEVRAVARQMRMEASEA